MGWKRKALFLGTGGLSRAAGVRISDQDTRTARATEKQVKLQKEQLKLQKEALRQQQLNLQKEALELERTRAALVPPRVRSRQIPVATTQTATSMPQQPTCAVRPCTALREPGSSYCPQHGPKVSKSETAQDFFDAKRMLDNAKADRAAGNQGAAIEAAERKLNAATAGPSQAPPQEQDNAPEDNPSTPGSSFVDELERLAALHRDGALSDEEFQAAKRRFIKP